MTPEAATVSDATLGEAPRKGTGPAAIEQKENAAKKRREEEIQLNDEYVTGDDDDGC